MIYVFKTSVQTKLQVRKLKPHLNQLLPHGQWNFDLEDTDRILRIDGEENLASKVTGLLNNHNFKCEELE